MHTNAIPGRLKADLDQLEGRTNARLDRLESMLGAIMRAAGLEPPPALPPATVDPPAIPTPSEAK
jgi:hypothetical protein